MAGSVVRRRSTGRRRLQRSRCSSLLAVEESGLRGGSMAVSDDETVEIDCNEE